MVEGFLAEGAAVVYSDLDGQDSVLVRETAARLGENASYVRADATDEGDWEAVRKHVEHRYGALHILVNNAGIDLTGPVETTALSDWRRIMAINIDGVFMGTRIFTPLLAASGGVRRGGASLINVSSIMGLVGYADTSAYNASKGAVRMFTKAIAIEFCTKKMPIRANSLHPGFVHTPLLQAGFDRWIAKGAAGSAQELVDAVAAQTPLGRLADPDEIAGAALFLASEDSSYMTGAELVIDGGWTAQ
jgi:NAD(P)-dependent dehydrogenase (short-subunit alcohol dehydrogenase family)